MNAQSAISTLEISASAGEIRNALKRVMPFASKDSTGGYVLIAADAGTVTLMATNMKQSAYADVPCEGGGAVCTLVGDLAAALSHLDSAEPVILRLDGGKLGVSQKRLRYSLPTFDAERFYEPQPFPADVLTWAVDVAALRQIEGAMGAEQARSYLCGVRFDFVARTLVATNGAVLGTMPMTAAPDIASFTLPDAAVKNVPDGAAVMAAAGNAVRIEIDSFRLVTQTIDAAYPDWQRVVPREPKCCVAVDAAEFVEALSAASIFGDRGSKIVVLNIEDGEIAISNTGPASSSATSCPCSLMSGSGARIGFDAQKLLWAARSLGNVDTLHIGYEDAQSPILITSPARDGWVRVVMPFRV